MKFGNMTDKELEHCLWLYFGEMGQAVLERIDELSQECNHLSECLEKEQQKSETLRDTAENLYDSLEEIVEYAGGADDALQDECVMGRASEALLDYKSLD